MLAWAMSPYFLDNAIISPTNTRHLLSESFFTVKGAALFLPRGNGTSSPRTGHRRSKHAADLQQHLHAMLNILRAEDNIKLETGSGTGRRRRRGGERKERSEKSDKKLVVALRSGSNVVEQES
uniref:uncharacterized protein isoform X1 n=1 Tax=Myxine glutinosa TaxID=7769 RepID=UPI00358E3821